MDDGGGPCKKSGGDRVESKTSFEKEWTSRSSPTQKGTPFLCPLIFCMWSVGHSRLESGTRGRGRSRRGS